MKNICISEKMTIFAVPELRVSPLKWMIFSQLNEKSKLLKQ